MVKLRENEKNVFLAISESGGKAKFDEIVQVTGLSHASAMRGLLKLIEEDIVRIQEKEHSLATLNEEGVFYAENGLPERRLVKAVLDLGGKATYEKAAKIVKIERKFLPTVIGWAVRKKWAKVEDDKRGLTSLKAPKEGQDERVLKSLLNKVVVMEDLSKDNRDVLFTLKKRKLVEIERKTVRTLLLTKKGWRLTKAKIETAREVSNLTPELIISRKWKNVRLRKFNVTAKGQPIFPGRIHPLQSIIERAREIFLEMGFTEIRGPLIETAFWNFDALFTPQDHPAREMQDTFYISTPRRGVLPEKSIVDAVAKIHHNGWNTGSKGWGYKWDKKNAKRLVLRTHTTPETIKYLSRHKTAPIKVFSVDKVFRNEQLTYKNTAEFYQIEGIVVDEDVTFRDLMGTLKTFYSSFGLKKVQFWPSYFPYTEPSAQAMFYIPKLKRWIELCGMGIFRPEVLAPFGIDYPVLAWGGGLERIAMVELNLEDIRKLYSNDLNWIRGTPIYQS